MSVTDRRMDGRTDRQPGGKTICIPTLKGDIITAPKGSFVISPEHHVLMVSYCDRSPSVFVVRPAGQSQFLYCLDFDPTCME